MNVNVQELVRAVIDSELAKVASEVAGKGGAKKQRLLQRATRRPDMPQHSTASGGKSCEADSEGNGNACKV